MKTIDFDVIVIGAGSGLRISSKAAELGLKTALIDEGPFGGTCLNRGCIPSKILIHCADVIEIIKNSKIFGIESKINKIPKKMAILGGGYISAELCHLFSSFGVDVTIIYRGNKLLKHEDEEISNKYTEIASKKYNLMLDTEVIEVNKKGKNILIKVKEKKVKNLVVDSLLITTGRVPNTDILKVEKSGIETDKNGFVKVDEYLETNVENVFAIGDIVGKYLFKHSANLEAEYCAQNAFGNKAKVDYKAMPHAIFTSPQIAGVGYTEQELKEKGINYLKGEYKYIDTWMGIALNDEDGFVKILVDPSNKKILGCHIIGSDASTLIHEVIVAMKNDLTVDQVASTVHIHPALSEVIQRACLSVVERVKNNEGI